MISDSFLGIYSGKQRYDVDECYEHDVGTEEIFSREIKPLIPGLFGGQNVTVFAYGPRNSGKTYTIQVGTVHFPSIMVYFSKTLSTTSWLREGGKGKKILVVK